MTGHRSSYGEAYWQGYERGMQSGHAAGYVEGVAVLDDAASALAGLRPSKTVAVAAARDRLTHPDRPALTPHQIRAQAAASWGLPIPADLPDTTTERTTGQTPGTAADPPPAVAAPAVAELADDDWAWAL